MNSQAKFKLFILILVALLVLGGVGLFAAYRFYPGNTNTVVNQNNGNQNTNAIVNAVTNTNESAGNTNEVNVNIGGEPLSDEQRVLGLARSFTERYGSFSNQNEFENLERLLIYMTPRLQKETQAFVASQEGKDNSVYYGVTTDAVSVRLEKLEEQKAVVFVSTRRKESREGSATNAFSQTARIVLVKDGGEWLVDKFDWQ